MSSWHQNWRQSWLPDDRQMSADDTDIWSNYDDWLTFYYSTIWLKTVSCQQNNPIELSLRHWFIFVQSVINAPPTVPKTNLPRSSVCWYINCGVAFIHFWHHPCCWRLTPTMLLASEYCFPLTTTFPHTRNTENPIQYPVQYWQFVFATSFWRAPRLH